MIRLSWVTGELQRRGRGACDKESLSKDGRKLQSRVQRLKAHIFHSLPFSLDHNFAHLWLVWDFPATAVGCSRPVICDRLLSIKRTPRCLGIVLCLISIWQSGWVNRLWISLNPLYSWASSVWAVTVKTSFCSVKKKYIYIYNFRPHINPICLLEKTRYHVQHATHFFWTELFSLWTSRTYLFLGGPKVCPDWSHTQSPALWMRPGQGDLWEGVIEGNNEGTVSEGSSSVWASYLNMCVN